MNAKHALPSLCMEYLEVICIINQFSALKTILWCVYQIVGVVNNDFSDGGAARIRQVRVGMVDGESAETCRETESVQSHSKIKNMPKVYL